MPSNSLWKNQLSPHRCSGIAKLCEKCRLEDLRDLELAIEENAGKPLTDWDQAKQELDL